MKFSPGDRVRALILDEWVSAEFLGYDGDLEAWCLWDDDHKKATIETARLEFDPTHGSPLILALK